MLCGINYVIGMKSRPPDRVKLNHNILKKIPKKPDTIAPGFLNTIINYEPFGGIPPKGIMIKNLFVRYILNGEDLTKIR